MIRRGLKRDKKIKQVGVNYLTGTENLITLIDRDVMRKEKRVVGNNPGFYKLNEVESIDIDTEFDFMVAEYIHNKLRCKNV